MQVKGFIKFAGANNHGYFQIQVIQNNKPIYIGFGVKAKTHSINGVQIEKGMLFEGEVDENNYNNYISGTVKKVNSGGNSGGGKSDVVGQAMGGAVNRANALVAANTIHPNAMVTNSLTQYMISEMCIHAVKTKKVKELNSIAGNIDTTSFDAVYSVFASFMSNKTEEPKQETPKTEPPKQEAPTQTPEDFGAGDSEFEDEVPF